VPVAAGYPFYAAFSHIVWSAASENGRGWPVGVLQAAAISTVGVLVLLLGKTRFGMIRRKALRRSLVVFAAVARCC
jgi:hypothetical protein